MSDFTSAQKRVIANNIAYLGKYLDEEEIKTLREMTDRTDLDIVHCHSIVGCIQELHGHLSFNGRMLTVQELSNLIKKYADR